MTYFKRVTLFFVFIFTLTLIPVSTGNAVDTESDIHDLTGLNLTSAAAIIIDFDTGLLIYEYNADELRVPASMVKMAAVYVVFDAISAGYIEFDTVIELTPEAIAFSYNRAFSNVPLLRDELYTVRDLLEVVIVRSASAATVALGEGLFGSEENLVKKMNEKAAELGITAYFRDSWGGSPQNRISARGMAELTRAMIKDYPEILEFTMMQEVVLDDISYRSTNPLLIEYPGVDGFKTGFTNPAGWCFTGTGKQGNRRIITVTMGSELGYRFLDSVILLDYGFSNINHVIADHFRSSLPGADLFKASNSMLIPINMLKINESRYITLKDLALILNET